MRERDLGFVVAPRLALDDALQGELQVVGELEIGLPAESRVQPPIQVLLRPGPIGWIFGAKSAVSLLNQALPNVPKPESRRRSSA